MKVGGFFFLPDDDGYESPASWAGQVKFFRRGVLHCCVGCGNTLG